MVKKKSKTTHQQTIYIMMVVITILALILGLIVGWYIGGNSII